MAYNANDRVAPDDMGTAIVRSYRASLAKRLPWLETVMRNYEPWPAGTRQIDIPILNSELNRDALTASVAVARNANWTTPADDSVIWDQFIPDSRAEAAMSIPMEDFDQLPVTLGVLEAHGRTIARKNALKINADIRAVKFGVAASEGAIAGSAADEANGAEGTHGGYVVHAAADTISDEGVLAGDAGDELLKMFDTYYLKATDDGFGQEAETPFQLMCFMDPATWVGLKNKLREEDISEAFNEALLTAARANTGFGDRLVAVINGINVLATNDVPKTQNTVGGSPVDFRQVLFTTNRDTEFVEVSTTSAEARPTDAPSIGADGAPTHGPRYARWVRAKYGPKGVDTRYGQVHRFRV